MDGEVSDSMKLSSAASPLLAMLVGLVASQAFGQALDVALDRLLADGQIVGAQAIVAERGKTVLEHCAGTVSVESSRKVDSDTLFCIGSCSKPFASALIMVLVDEGLLALDDSIDRHLPAFGNLEIVGSGRAQRAPTLRELLCHRSGVYSQKRRLTEDQRRLIRDFRLTLEESVDGIASHKLIARPGSEFAYSGAGYCVVGRLAEAATGQPIERLIRQRLAKPLGLRRTTYFPAADDQNVAAGAVRDDGSLQTDRQTPHTLGADLRLPLVGGSLYSTARETARFGEMIAGRGRIDSRQIISSKSWQELTTRQADQPYGLGWTLTIENGRTVRLAHNGSLASSRSKLRVDLDTGRCVVVHYTVAGPDERPAGTVISQAVDLALNQIE